MPFLIQTQQKSLWCWAAVSVSVDHYFSPLSQSFQCGVAAKVIPVPACCTNPPLQFKCNKPASLEKALTEVGKLRGAPQPPLSFTELRAEIDAHRPVCARIGWRNGGGHFVVISGAGTLANGLEVVIVKDPLFPNSTVAYDDFRFRYQGRGRWTTTYFLQP